MSPAAFVNLSCLSPPARMANSKVAKPREPVLTSLQDRAVHPGPEMVWVCISVG